MIALPARARSVRGEVEVPGDKSVGHRAIILGSLAEGQTEVLHFSGGEDNLRTQAIFEALGVEVRAAPGRLSIRGAGLRGLHAPACVLDCGNSGTSMRLIAGVLAGQPFESVLDGDASLRRRPMRRVAAPLRAMGASIETSPEGTAPLVLGGRTLRGIDYALPMASAQVKSCLLLAALYAQGTTRLREPGPSRDHTERMLAAFGAPVRKDGEWLVAPQAARLQGTTVDVPGDLSSAAFPLAAALLLPGSEVTVHRVGLNPTRTGILDVWRAMGADISVREEPRAGSEPVGSITIRHASLRGVDVGGELVIRAIDEVPVLALCAAAAEGLTRIRDAAELRTKESDRLAALAREIGKLGARVTEHPDGLDIEGPAPFHAATFESDGDHRIAMIAAVAALRASGPCAIDEVASIDTSFPGFFPLLESLCHRSR
jgi:3-phosphoshikimate 1-carboxyvinyltransferase